MESIPWSWIILIGGLIFAVYTLWVIKREKKIYLSSPKTYELGPYVLKVPQWWGEEMHSSQKLIFQRHDTHYEWQATFELEHLELNDDVDQPLDQVFAQKLKAKELQFDLEATILSGPECFTEHPLLQTNYANQVEILRIEGTATQRKEKRVYYDALILRDKHRQKLFYCESLSSVLNGMVEGPYFEHIIQNISIHHH